VDPGAFVSPNSPVVEVVDITRVRMVANIIEKDLKQIGTGDMARVQVDAFPGEDFMGRIARVSPVLDPSTRTAPIEVEISNPQYRLKPGMYARVGIVTESHPNALVVPTNAVVDVNGTRGVYLSVNNAAAFHPVKIGIEGNERTEILDGVAAGDRVVTTGAAGLRNGDPIILAGGAGRGGRGNRGSLGSEGSRTSEGSRGSGGPNPGFAGRRGGKASAEAGAKSLEPGAGGGEGRRGSFAGQRGQRTGGAAPQSQ
jgi:membrane fusion protein (multidrug efflux system)